MYRKWLSENCCWLWIGDESEGFRFCTSNTHTLPEYSINYSVPVKLMILKSHLFLIQWSQDSLLTSPLLLPLHVLLKIKFSVNWPRLVNSKSVILQNNNHALRTVILNLWLYGCQNDLLTISHSGAF